MSEFQQHASESENVSRQILENGNAAAEAAMRGVEQSNSSAAGSVRDLNLKLIDMAEANVGAAFNLAREIAGAEAPSDIVGLWAAHARKQFEMLTEQTNELTALGRKLVVRS